jgi:hypothetical protein
MEFLNSVDWVMVVFGVYLVIFFCKTASLKESFYSLKERVEYIKSFYSDSYNDYVSKNMHDMHLDLQNRENEHLRNRTHRIECFLQSKHSEFKDVP